MSRTTSHLWAEIEAWLDALPFAPSQARLAERLGLKSRTVITDWKYGASRPTPEHLRALAREMELGAGPHIYERLLAAVVRDMGYTVKHGTNVEVFAGPEGTYISPDLTVSDQEGNFTAIEAKRTPGRKAARKAPSAGRARRAQQDADADLD